MVQGSKFRRGVLGEGCLPPLLQIFISSSMMNNHLKIWSKNYFLRDGELAVFLDGLVHLYLRKMNVSPYVACPGKILMQKGKGNWASFTR